ncbi:copper resistance CopC/CopD family protein [Paenibacillus oceani]|uniref:Copper resistance protein CopC n=1 Tax=Paenibacillus oceani TaxID=2772510 RepID=A0A927H0A6_9BACL|nr:copper resistance protein CopC [Paenibacillus oceani]MBD2863495.1 copper resistance protein CopC [Paenibacillus oceani]
MNLMKRWLVAAAIMLFGAVLLISPERVSAHAVLTKAVPEANSQLNTAPERIELTFNERLEAELYYIKVFDEIGREISDRKATLSGDQKAMQLELPKLSNGRYTVTYHVISADGHPVEGTYVLSIGPGSEGALIASPESLHAGHSLSADMSVYDILKYISRIAYFFGLLAVAGWVFWGIAAGLNQSAVSGYYRNGLLSVQRTHFLALIAFVYFHYQDLLGDQGFGELIGLFTGTWVGRSWLIAFVLSLVGFAMLGRSKAGDAVWIVLLLAAKSVNGHAMGYEPRVLTVSLDFIHLLGAAIWVGGLLLIVPAWKKNRTWIDSFLPVFSRYALISIIVLTLSGTATTLLYLPGLNYLLYSQWGKLLIAKVVFVVLVILMAVGIRMAMRGRKEKDLRDMVRMDFGAMSIIVVLVGLLTFISPVPPNEPLYWHQMGEKVHATVQITPKVPGDNRFQVDVWLPKELDKPKRVQLKLHNLDNPDIAPIEVPLAEHINDQEDAGFTADETYGQFSYKAEGPYLPFAGLWKLEFRLLDKNDDETVYTEQTRLY